MINNNNLSNFEQPVKLKTTLNYIIDKKYVPFVICPNNIINKKIELSIYTCDKTNNTTNNNINNPDNSNSTIGITINILNNKISSVDYNVINRSSKFYFSDIKIINNLLIIWLLNRTSYMFKGIDSKMIKCPEFNNIIKESEGIDFNINNKIEFVEAQNDVPDILRNNNYQDIILPKVETTLKDEPKVEITPAPAPAKVTAPTQITITIDKNTNTDTNTNTNTNNDNYIKINSDNDCLYFPMFFELPKCNSIENIIKLLISVGKDSEADIDFDLDSVFKIKKISTSPTEGIYLDLLYYQKNKYIEHICTNIINNISYLIIWMKCSIRYDLKMENGIIFDRNLTEKNIKDKDYIELKENDFENKLKEERYIHLVTDNNDLFKDLDTYVQLFRINISKRAVLLKEYSKTDLNTSK